jgi:hypothetical protein
VLIQTALDNPRQYPDVVAWVDRRAMNSPAGFGWFPVVMAAIAGVSAIAGIAQGEAAKKQQKKQGQQALKLQKEKNAQELALQQQVAATLQQQGVAPQNAAALSQAVTSDTSAQRNNNALILGAIGLGALLLLG